MDRDQHVLLFREILNYVLIRRNIIFRELLYALGYIRIRHIRVLGTILSVFVKSKHILHLRQIETEVNAVDINTTNVALSPSALFLSLFAVRATFLWRILGTYYANINLVLYANFSF